MGGSVADGFGAHVESRRSGNMRKVEAGAPGGASRRVDGRDVVVHFAIGVEREPVAEVREAIGEVESAETSTGVVAAILDLSAWRRKAEEAFEKGMQSNRSVALAAPDHGAFKAEFEILGGTEADLFKVHPGVAWVDHIELIWTGIPGVGHISVAMETADEELVAKWSGDIREARNMQRLNPIDAERVDIFRIV